ncbi:MAG: hypothetical protein AVDCRST_MAG55-3062, partial [uncultured Rubrobacteraceae bacterium]
CSGYSTSWGTRWNGPQRPAGTRTSRTCTPSRPPSTRAPCCTSASGRGCIFRG